MIAGHRQSAPTRTREEIDALDQIDMRVHELASSLGAREMQYPALIAREVLDRAGYPSAFPHLLMFATRNALPERGDTGQSPSAGREAEDRDDGKRAHDWCLSPAVCYHTFAQLAGRVIENPTVLTARGRCFRAECETAPGIRQVEFEMREIVLMGPITWIDACAEAARQAIEAIAARAGVTGEWQAAADPFFLPAASGRAMMQRLLKVKLEYQSPGAGGLALCSINRHGAFFGERFGISTPEGEPLHTACIAFGLDRWSHCCRGHAVAAETEYSPAHAGQSGEAQS
ncbi:MAG: hypothetical protein ACRD3C_04695 [Vicinamibacterales bacterium]